MEFAPLRWHHTVGFGFIDNERSYYKQWCHFWQWRHYSLYDHSLLMKPNPTVWCRLISPRKCVKRKFTLLMELFIYVIKIHHSMECTGKKSYFLKIRVGTNSNIIRQQCRNDRSKSQFATNWNGLCHHFLDWASLITTSVFSGFWLLKNCKKWILRSRLPIHFW